jgi:hypothetical protein
LSSGKGTRQHSSVAHSRKHVRIVGLQGQAGFHHSVVQKAVEQVTTNRSKARGQLTAKWQHARFIQANGKSLKDPRMKEIPTRHSTAFLQHILQQNICNTHT